MALQFAGFIVFPQDCIFFYRYKINSPLSQDDLREHDTIILMSNPDFQLSSKELTHFTTITDIVKMVRIVILYNIYLKNI